jgi:hypothetical protein
MMRFVYCLFFCLLFSFNSYSYNIDIRQDSQVENSIYKGIGWDFDGYTVGERIKLGEQIGIYIKLKEVLKSVDIPNDLNLDIIIDSNYVIHKDYINNMKHTVTGTYFKHRGTHQIYLRDFKNVQRTFVHELGHVYESHYNINLKRFIKEVCGIEYKESKSWYENPKEIFAENFKKVLLPNTQVRTIGKCERKKFIKFLQAYGIYLN